MVNRLPVWLLSVVVLATTIRAEARPQDLTTALVQGLVLDASTGDPMASATVQLEGTFTGTITNPDGRFSLRVPGLPVTVLVRFIGYAGSRVEVTDEREIVIRLVPEAVTMPEIVISGEDPAIGIMRRVIARKKEWRADLDRFRADAYTRLVIENDTGIVSMTESLSDFWWDRELGRREVVRGSRRTANLPIESIVPAALAVSNLYDDDVELAGTTFMGVTHPDALESYDVRLVGMRSLDGTAVFDISVEPRSRLSSAFVGRVSVLDSSYALIEAELRPGDSFLFPPPIQFFDITLRQQFASFGGPFMLPVDFRAEYELKFGLRGLLDFPAIHIRQVSRLDGYEVNGPRADSVFAVSDEFVTDSAAVASDALVANGTVVPMTLREQEAMTAIDSTGTMDRAFRPTGLLARFVRVGASGGDSRDGRSREGRRFTLDVSPELWVDRVSGVHGAADVTVGRGPVTVGGIAGYDSAPGSYAWGAHAELRLFSVGTRPGLRRAGRNRVPPAGPAPGRVSVFGSYRDGIANRFVSRTQDPFFNTLRVVFGGHDYFDYLRRERVEIGLRWTALRSDGWRFETAYRVDHDRSVATGKPVRFTGTATPRPNPGIVDGTLRTWVARARIGSRPDDFGFSGATGAEMTMEFAPAGTRPGAETFLRADLRVDLRLSTLVRRRLLPNVLDVTATAGHAWGALPPQRWGVVDGTGGYSSFGALRTLEEVFYEGSSHVFLAWEHNFRTVPFELIGAYGLARRNYALILTGAHGRTWLSDASRALARHVPFESGGWHHEIGLSLSGLARVFRMDVTRRLDAAGWRFGIGTARLF